MQSDISSNGLSLSVRFQNLVSRSRIIIGCFFVLRADARFSGSSIRLSYLYLQDQIGLSSRIHDFGLMAVVERCLYRRSSDVASPS